VGAVCEGGMSVRCSLLQCVAACVAVCCTVWVQNMKAECLYAAVRGVAGVAVWCSAGSSVCCSGLQCAAVRCRGDAVFEGEMSVL